MLDINTLEACKRLLKKEITEHSNRPFRIFRTEEEVRTVFFDLLARAFKLGDYSYDPTTGEICWKIGKEHEIDVFSRLEGTDDRLIANIIRDVLEGDGWNKVIILPPVTGANRIFIKMQSDEIKSGIVAGVIPLEKKIVKKK